MADIPSTERGHKLMTAQTQQHSLPGSRRRPASAHDSRGGRPGASRRTHERHARLRRLAIYSQLASVGFVLLMVLVIVGVQVAEGDQIRSGVRAWGVDLGGMTREDARAALSEAARERTSQPLRLTDRDKSWELSAADLGLVMDVDRVVNSAFETGRDGLGPSRLALLWHFRDEPLELGVDSIGVQGDMLDAEVAALAQSIDRERIDPSLTVEPTTGVTFIAAQTGRTLDVQSARTRILSALATGRSTVALPVDEDAPPARNEDFAAARDQLMNIWDAPIELVAADQTWTLDPAQISTRLMVMQPANGQPATVQIDETWIDDVVTEISFATDQLPQSPRLWWDVSGALIQTAEGKPGRDLDEAMARPMILAAFLGQDTSNRLDLPVTIANSPALPSDLNTLGITSNIAEARTEYGGGLPERMHNIELAARLLNGVVVMPGQTFSFNAEIGPMTLDAGFQMGYGIAEGDDGKLQTIPAEAGGICQVATTVFQPVFWTGYQIDQRTTHSYWIPGYTYQTYVGLDATVEPSIGLDFKWTNNSSTAVLIEAATDGKDFIVRLYGTMPNWRVEIDKPVIENIVPADQTVHYEPSPSIPDGKTRRIERAQDGFDVKIVRRVIEGDDVRTLELKSTYGPSRNVVLVGSQTGELPPDFVPPE